MEKKGNTYMRTDFDFPRWYSLEAKEGERELYERVYGFEELFADMMFRPGTPSGELIKVQSKANDDEEWEDDEMDLPEELTGCPYSYFEYKVEKKRVYVYNRKVKCINKMIFRMEGENEYRFNFITVNSS